MTYKKNRVIITGLTILIVIVFYYFGEIVLSQTKDILHHTGLYNKDAAFRRRASFCDETRDYYTLLPRQGCDEVLLLILVSSIVENSNTRKAIREYWGKTTNLSRGKRQEDWWRAIFIVGLSQDDDNTSIEKESVEYNDVLRWEFDDNQEVLKSILGFHWASCRCHSKYVLQTRDNVFVNIHALGRLLQGNTVDSSRIYTGVLSKASDLKPARNSSVKNFTPLESYSESIFPAFIVGPVRLLSIDVVDRILHYVPRVKTFPSDEAYTGVVVQKTGTKPLDNDKFLVKTLDSIENPCNLKEVFALSAKTMADFSKIFNSIEESKKNCKGINKVGRRRRGK